MWGVLVFRDYILTLLNYDSEIPGFYYDAEKKKYFRILPGHAGNTNVVTKETIDRKEAESVRQEKICNLDSTASSCVVINTAVNKRKSRNVFDHLRNHEVLLSSSMATDSAAWHRQCVHHTLSNLRPRGKVAAEIPPINDEAAKLCLQMSAQHEAEQTHLLSLWSNENGNFHRLQISELNSIRYTDEDKSVKLGVDHSLRGLTYFDIRFTNVLWAPTQTPGMCNVIYGAMSVFPGGCRNLVFLYMSLNEVVPIIHSYHLANHDLWCVAWNQSGHSFSAGCDKNTVLVDVETGRRQTMFCMNENVYAQQFSQVRAGTDSTKSFWACKGNLLKILCVSHDSNDPVSHVTNLLQSNVMACAK